MASERPDPGPESAPAGPRPLRIGTRGSALALVQARWVGARLAEVGVETVLEIIRTEGDDRPPDTAWGEGAFVTAIEAALVAGRVDIAVHSAKDLPTDEDQRLVVAAFPPREDPRDALVCRVRGGTLATLPPGSRVGTDSPRRTAFLRAIRPDLVFHPLSGNVDTRLRKLDDGESDALVLAVAGLTRLGRADRIDEVLEPDVAAPAPGQGSLAIQVRAADAFAREAVGQLDDPATRAAVEAERAFLWATGGGCRSPIGALGRVEDGRLRLRAGAARDVAAEAASSVAAAVDAPPAPAPAPVAAIAWLEAEGAVEDRLTIAAELAARVVRLRTRRRVLVTRPDAQAGPLVDALAARGVDAVVVPTIEIRSVAPGGPLDDAVAATASGSRIVVTSANGAEATLAAAGRVGIDPTTRRWAAVGDATAATLRAGGVEPDFVPSRSSGRALGEELPLAAGEPILLARADIADEALPAALRARGAAVTEAVAYTTHEAPATSAPRLDAALTGGPIDAIVATSGSTLRGLLTLAGTDRADACRAIPVVAIGGPTGEAARALGFTAVAEAGMARPDALAAAVDGALVGRLVDARVTPSTAASQPDGDAR
jgi:hydroxymethylbilane synthase